MKVLIDLTALADNFSGIERYAACLAHEMIKKNNNDYILLFKDAVHPMFSEYQKESHIKFVIIPGCKKLLFNQIKLPLAIYKQKADWYLFMAFPVPVLLFKKNMVSTIHDICCWDCPETMNGMSNWYFKISHMFAMIKCKRIITISRFSKSRIIDKLKYSKKKIWIIYCGVDDKFLNCNIDMDEFGEIRKKYNLPRYYYLSLSTLEPRKNLQLLVQAYNKLFIEKKVSEPLVLAGRKGWKIEELLKGIDERTKNNIIFTDFIEDNDLPAIYANAELFIFPSMYEGFGMPPLEALACGAKVLSSDSSSLPEVLGDAAFYFKNGDIDDLCYQILHVGTPKDISFGVNQVKKFMWSREADKLLKLMRDI